MSFPNRPSNDRPNDLSETNYYKYDVAVSYDSHSRELVQKVVTYLRSEKYEVFYDLDRRLELLSENLEAKLYQVYQNESLVKALFVTNEYLNNDFTLLEARRSFISAKENCRRLIVINFLGKDLPKPYCDFAYLDGALHADEIAYIIGERIKELKKECCNYGNPSEAGANAKVYIKNINKVGRNTGIVTGNNATIHNVSLHKRP